MVAIVTGMGNGLERSSLNLLGAAGQFGHAQLGRGGQNVYVNAATGTLTLQRTDEVLIGRGPDQTLSTEFTNGSAYWHTPNWKCIYGITGVVNTAGSTVSRLTAFYDTIVYTYDSARGAYVNKDGGGAHDEVRNVGGVWSFTDGDSRQVEYYEKTWGPNFLVSRVVDTDGNTQSYTYDSSGVCIGRITNADGSFVEMTNTGNRPNEIKTSYINASGGTSVMTRIRYAWDSVAVARLNSLTVDLTPHDNSIADGNVYQINYTYDGSTQRLTSITQTDGSRLDIGYDASNRVISYSETVAAGVARTTTLTYETDAYGNKYTRIRDAKQQDTLLYYDAKGRLTKVVSPPPSAGAAAPSVTYAYNADGDLISATDALGHTKTYTHDANGNVLTETDRLGNMSYRRYNSANRLMAETRSGSNSASSDAAHTTRYAYDSEQHLRYVISPEGLVTEYRYTAAGEVEYTIEYPEHLYPSSNLGSEHDLSEAQLNAWRDGLADRSSTKIGVNTFDARGQLTSSAVYGISTPAGGNSAAEGYSRTVYAYSQAGQLLTRVKDGQYAESFIYDGLGRLTGSTDLNGGTTSIVYSDAATQTVVTLASGFVRTSTYNKAGDLVSTTESGSHVAGGTSTNKYDQLGRLRMTTDAAGFNKYFVYDKVGRLVAEVLHWGQLTEYRYDANGRVTGTLTYMNGVSSANMALLADPNSNLEMSQLNPGFHPWDVCTWQFYDKEGRVTGSMNSGGDVRTFEYDKSGRLVKTLAYANRLDYSLAIHYKSNSPTQIFLPSADAARDSISRNFYDKDGRLIAVLDGEGYLSRTIYDKAGQKVEELAYLNATNTAYRASGTLNDLIATTPAHADDRRTRFVYDSRGFLRFQIDGLNQVTEFGYDVAGQVTSTIRYAGSIAATSDFTYDNVKYLVGVSGLASHGATRRSWAVYDERGRMAYSIDAEDAVTRFTYDNRGQVTKSVQYAAKRTGTTSLPSQATMDSWAAANDGNAANRITRNYYSARGELRFTVDAEGYVSRTDFDAAGRVIRDVRWDTAVAAADWWTIDTINANAAGTWVDKNYAYAWGGELTNVWDSMGTQTQFAYYGNLKLAYRSVFDNDQSWTYYTYDGAGRVVEEYAANGAPEYAHTVYGYDGHGNLTYVRDPNGNATTRTFDKLGRVRTETNAAAGVTTFEYNAFGEVVKATDARGNATYNYYDKEGRLTASRDPESYVTETSYSVFGEATSVTRRYNQAYNAAAVGSPPAYSAHAKDATTSFQYDRLGRVTRTTDAEGYYEQYTLDAWGNRISVTNKIGGVVANGYDRRGLLTSETLPMASYDSNGNVVSSAVTNRFEYDARGNRTKKVEAHGLSEQRTTLYVYDKEDRLIETRGDAVSVLSQSDHASVSSVVPTEKYKYDAKGRVIEKTDALGGRTLFYYDKMNRKTAEIGPAGTYSAYTYDRNGNLTASRVYGTAVALPATAGGPAPAAPGGEYRETTHTYDAVNRLKTTTVANVRTGFWNGSAYQSGVGAITTTIDYDANGNVIKTTDGNGGTSFTFYDKANRKIAQVDPENYLTAWTLDGEGNVLQEDRYATRLGYAVAPTYDVAWMRSTVAGAGPDRSTQFVYDRNGRRTSEYRLFTFTHSVDAYGTLSQPTTHSGIWYNYNGLGQVSQKSYANGDLISYVYDSAGRLTQESRAAYDDLSTVTVRPTTFYYYNGVNNLMLSRQGGQSQSGSDRLTRYAYGTGGRMTSMTDAAGNTYNYYHDAAGNVLRENYNRVKSDGSAATEGVLYTRDVLGRATSQALATWYGYWAKGDSQDSAYNAYGDVAQRGVNGGWQEQFAYDGAGRVWRSNSGDGVWRFFVHDGAGNRTLTLESEGTDLAGYSLDSAMAAATANGSVGGGYVDGITATMGIFDKRGQQTGSREAFRQIDPWTIQTLTTARTYTAFGEVASETDARGSTTNYSYNTLGKLTQKQSPLVSYTPETGIDPNGYRPAARPTENYYYDASGRMIGVRDANNNLTTRILLGGTGHDGSEALVTAEFHSDGGVFRTFYDVFGDARILRDELGQDETRLYDAMGRLTQATHRGGLLVDYYAHDLLGQRIRHWNSVLGGYNVETTDYDAQGRVTRQVTFGGLTTNIGYAWNGGIATTGMGTFGGWTKTISHVSGYSNTETLDLFGRTTAKTDLAGRSYGNTYDKAGRLVAQNGPSGQYQSLSYYNTGRVSQIDDYAGWGLNSITATYRYDAGGNRTYEGYAGTVYAFHHGNYHISEYKTLQSATVAYDALGRVTAFTNHDANGAVTISVTNEYDLVGNVRRTRSVYPNLAYPQHGSITSDKWFRYDSMNRMVTADGVLENGQVVRGSMGSDITYDAAGRRRSATHGASLTGYAYVWVPDEDPYLYPEPITVDPGDGSGGHYEYRAVNYWGARREEYEYRADGYLMNIRFSDEGYYDPGDGSGNLVADGTMGAAVLRANNYRDNMGRVTQYLEYDAAGSTVTYNRYSIVYDGANRVTSEALSQRKTESGVNNTYLTYTTNNYGWNGTLSSTFNDTYKNSSDSGVLDNSTSYQYALWDDYRVSSTTHDSDTNNSNTLWHSYYYYDGLGRLASVDIADGRRRTVSFASNPSGQVLSRVERSAAANNPLDYYYFVDGMQVGELTNNGNNDPTRVDYSTTLQTRNWSNNPVSAPFRWNTNGGVTHGQFGGSGYDPISPTSNGMQGTDGRVTVRDGDTLQSIAASQWGDASLWYMLAEANGLSGSEALAAGSSLIVPSKVTNIHNNSRTFEVYDPNRALGDLSPTAAKPPKKQNKCGILGTVVLIAISIAVTALTYGAASAALGPVLGGAVAGAAGSVVSQGFGVATGLQDKFSWKGVAMAAIGGAVGGGVGQVFGKAGMFGSQFVGDAIRGAVGSALTQGIGVATGLQKKFDWAGVAAAGIGSAVSSAFARKAFNVSDGRFDKTVAGYTQQFTSSMAGAIANAATRSLVGGTSFGDNLIAALPDVIGSTIGNLAADGAQGTWGRTYRSGGAASGAGGGSAAQTSGTAQSGVGQGNGAAAEPAPGTGGGVVDHADDGEEIIVTGTRINSTRNVVNGVRTAGANGATPSGGPSTSSTEEQAAQAVAGIGNRQLNQSRNARTLEELGEWWAGYRRNVANDPRLHDNDLGVLAGFQRNLDDLLAAVGEASVPIAEYFDLALPENIDWDGGYIGSDGFELDGIIVARDGHYGLGGTYGLNYDNGHFSIGDGWIFDHNNGDTSILSGVYSETGGTHSAWWGAATFGNGRTTALWGLVDFNNGGVEIAGQELRRPYSDPRSRPSYAPGQVEAVWDAATRNGRVYDPNTGEQLTWDRARSRAGQWDMGHRPGHEYRVLHQRYMDGTISLQQFLSEYRNPANYQPESPSANRSRRYERR